MIMWGIGDVAHGLETLAAQHAIQPSKPQPGEGIPPGDQPAELMPRQTAGCQGYHIGRLPQ